MNLLKYLAFIISLVIISCDQPKGSDSIFENSFEYSFEDIYQYETMAASTLEDNVYYRSSEITFSDSGYMFVPTRNNYINIYNSENLELVNSFQIDSEINSSSGNDIDKSYIENNLLFIARGHKFLVYDISDISTISCYYSKTIDFSDNGFCDFSKAGNYFYIPTPDGMDIYFWDSLSLSYLSSIEIELTNEEKNSYHMFKSHISGHFLTLFTFSNSDNKNKSVITYNISNKTSPVLVENVKDLSINYWYTIMLDDTIIFFEDWIISIYQIIESGELETIYDGVLEPLDEEYDFNGDLLVSDHFIADISDLSKPKVIVNSFSKNQTKAKSHKKDLYLFEKIQEIDGQFSEVQLKKYSKIE